MIFPGLEWRQQDQSILSTWIKELISQACLGCSDQNLLRLLKGVLLCPRGKRDFPIDYWQVGIAYALKNLREMQTVGLWEGVQHRNGECWGRRLLVPASAISLFRFYFLLCSAFIS